MPGFGVGQKWLFSPIHWEDIHLWSIVAKRLFVYHIIWRCHSKNSHIPWHTDDSRDCLKHVHYWLPTQNAIQRPTLDSNKQTNWQGTVIFSIQWYWMLHHSVSLMHWYQTIYCTEQKNRQKMNILQHLFFFKHYSTRNIRKLCRIFSHKYWKRMLPGTQKAISNTIWLQQDWEDATMCTRNYQRMLWH